MLPKLKTSLSKTQTDHLLATIAICFAIGCWGGAYVAARYLLRPANAGFVSLSPVLLAALRFSIASLFFVIPFVRAILRRQLSARDLLLVALLGQLTFAVYYWFQYIGIQQTNASLSAILAVGLIPLFTAVLSPAFDKAAMNISLFVALLLGLAGVALIVFQQPLIPTLQAGFFLGIGCLVFNAFSFALYTHLSQRWMQTISPLVMTGGTMISGTCGLLLFSFVDPAGNQWASVTRLARSQWAALLFLAVACSALAYFAYHVALRKMHAARVTVYFYVEPAVTILLGAILLGERLSWQEGIGALLIAGAVGLVHRNQGEHGE
jgi:drug/metabolite transporter (DMT)-like permease